MAIALTDIARKHLAEGDRLVKTLGDAVLLASTTPASGLAAVRAILDECNARDLYLSTRTGMHHGPASQRADDFFGASVNLAARVAAHASGGQVLATTDLGTTTFRNVGTPVHIHELHLVLVLLVGLCHAVRRIAGFVRQLSFWERRRSALEITLTEDSAMAAAAMIGDSSMPVNG